jgi:hypothetical protein
MPEYEPQELDDHRSRLEPLGVRERPRLGTGALSFGSDGDTSPARTTLPATAERPTARVDGRSR